MPYVTTVPGYGEVLIDDSGMMYSIPDGENTFTQQALGYLDSSKNRTDSGVSSSPSSEVNAADMWKQGYFSDIGALNQGQYVTGAGGQSFPDTLSYLNYLYGGNITPETVNGETFYKVDNLAQGPQAGATPITYNAPDSMGAQLVKAGILGLAGAGLTGMLPGTENVFAGLGGGAGPTVASDALLTGAGPTVGADAALAGSGSGLVGGTTGLELGSLGGSVNLGGANIAGSAIDPFFPAITGNSLIPESVQIMNVPSITTGSSTSPSSGSNLINSNLGNSVVDSAFPGATDLAGPTAANTAATTGTAAATAANAASTGTALSRVIGQLSGNGEASAADWASVMGTLGTTFAGIYGANQTSDAFKEISDQYLNMGAPHRARLDATFQPGFDLSTADPAFKGALDQAAQAAARATSSRVGNPVDNPGAYAEMQKYITNSVTLPQLNTYRSQLGTFGQLGTNTAGAASMAGAQSNGGAWEAAGYGMENLFNPRQSIFGNQNNSWIRGLLSNNRNIFSF